MNTRDIYRLRRWRLFANKIAAEADFADRYADSLDRTLCVCGFDAGSSAGKRAKIRVKETNIDREQLRTA
jgi:hypothetical protein